MAYSLTGDGEMSFFYWVTVTGQEGIHQENLFNLSSTCICNLLPSYPNILKTLGISSVGFDSSAVVFWVSAFINL